MGILSDDLTVSYGTAPFLLSMKSSNKMGHGFHSYVSAFVAELDRSLTP
jgi:hypothetical protein